MRDRSSLKRALTLACAARRDLDDIEPSMGAAAKSVISTLVAIGDAERALFDVGGADGNGNKWAMAATRPAAWHSLSLSAAAFAATPSTALAHASAMDAFAASADIVRKGFDADEILEPLVHSHGGARVREPSHHHNGDDHNAHPR
jgi:hypothetical protein